LRVPSFAGPVVTAVAGLIYPPLCNICLCPLASAIDGVCPACRDSMRRIDRRHPLRMEGESKLAAGGAIDAFLAAFLFEKKGPLQSALHLLKYSGMHSLGVWFGREVGEAMRDDPAFGSADRLVPVPLHPARLRERGYNQAERICAGIAGVTGVPVAARALARARNTPSQTTLKIHEREENVRGAFRAGARCAEAVRGKTVVLVDDVMTTGSTVIACALVLRAAGAAKVLAATVAVADRAG
jgi:ComF family protein